MKAAVERLLPHARRRAAPLRVHATWPRSRSGEAALLAGLISNPEGNNPFVAPRQGASARRSLVLRADGRAGLHHPGAGRRPRSRSRCPTIKPRGRAAPGDVVGRGGAGPALHRPDVLRCSAPRVKEREEHGAHRRAEDLRDDRPERCRLTRRTAIDRDPAGEAGLHRRRSWRSIRRTGVREGDGRRPRLRGQPVQHRDQLSRPSGRVDVEGDHARRRARERVLAERPGRRLVAVRVRAATAARRTPEGGDGHA